jgi:thiamine pyrophosphokinase
MSSHHVVREKQEPALLVLGLDNFADELLGQLLEWSPTVITTPQTAERLNAYGIKIDWIITNDADGALQSDVKLLPTNADTLINAALKHLITHGFPSVNIVTDEVNLADYEPYATQINLVIFNNGKKIFPINSGFSKWKPAGETIELLTPGKKLEVKGLEKINDRLYKTIRDGLFSLHFDGPLLFIAEEL